MPSKVQCPVHFQLHIIWRIPVVVEATWPTTANYALRLGSLDFSEMIDLELDLIRCASLSYGCTLCRKVYSSVPLQ